MFRYKTISNAYRVMKNYNRKISRLQNKNKTKLLPSKLSKIEMNSIINSSNTLRDLKRELKTLENFTKRGGEQVIKFEGVEMLKADKKNIQMLRRSGVMRLKSELSLELERQGGYYKPEFVLENPFTARFLGSTVNTILTKIKRIKTPVKYIVNQDKTKFNKKEIKEYEQSIQDFKVTRGVTGLKDMTTTGYIKMMKYYTRDSNKWRDFQNNFIEMMVSSGYGYGENYRKVHILAQKLRSISDRDFYKLYTKHREIETLIYGYHNIMEFDYDSPYVMEIADDYREDFDTLLENIDDYISEL